MSVDQEDFYDDLAAYALGALMPAERQRMEVRLRSNSSLAERQRLDEYLAVRDVLPFALTQHPAPAAAKARLMARLHGAAEEEQHHDPSRRSRWVETVRALRSLRWALASLALLAAVVWNVTLQLQPMSPGAPGDTIEARARTASGPGYALVGTGAPAAAAHLLVAADGQSAELAVSGLPLLRPERTYQVWFARPGQPTETGGAFRVDDRGQALVQIVVPVPLDEVSAIAITEEPMPASLRPTGPHLLDGHP